MENNMENNNKIQNENVFAKILNSFLNKNQQIKIQKETEDIPIFNLLNLMEIKFDTEEYSFNDKQLDEFFGKIKNGNLITLAARPGNGKTFCSLVFFLKLIKNYSYKQSSLFFSVEMPIEEIYFRIKNSSIVQEKNEEYEFNKIIGESLNFEQLILIILKQKQENPNLKFIFIDYLQMLNFSTKKFNNITEQIEEMMRILKNIAKTLKLIFFVNVQLNRDCEKRKEKEQEIQMSDLKGSSAIEQYSDKIITMQKNKALSNKENFFLFFQKIKDRHGIEAKFLGKINLKKLILFYVKNQEEEEEEEEENNYKEYEELEI